MKATTMRSRLDSARRNATDFGMRVCAKRKQEGLSLAMLSKLLEIDKVWLLHVEHGRFVLPPDQADRLIEWVTG